MKSNLVRVDFRKNHKSEKAQDNHGFRFNQQKLFEGEVTIFQTKKSGENIKAVEKGMFGVGH